MQTVTVTPGKVHQTKYGALPHSDMIGRQFGTKVCYTLSLTNVASFLALEQQANVALMFLSHNYLGNGQSQRAYQSLHCINGYKSVFFFFQNSHFLNNKYCTAILSYINFYLSSDVFVEQKRLGLSPSSHS